MHADSPARSRSSSRRRSGRSRELLYDLTALQRHANTLYGFSARRTLAAAQKLYEEQKAITYPRTSSRYLSGDLVEEIRPTAELVGHNPYYAKAAEYVVALQQLPLARIVNDAKVTDHHAIIPTRAEHDVEKFSDDEKRIYDLVVKRFLSVVLPRGGVRAHARRDDRRRARLPHERPRAGRGRLARGLRRGGRRARAPRRTTPAATSCCRGSSRARPCRRSRSSRSRKETQPPRRFTEASLLAAMETAGKDIEDAELREAMKDSGIGTPATRAAIIERLISVGYIEREGRALHATEKGVQVIRLLGEHPLTSPELTGSWEHRLGLIEQGEDEPPGVHGRHRQVHDRDRRRARQAQGGQDRAGQPRPVPGLRPRRDREPQGLLVLVEGRPRLRLRDLEAEGGQDPAGPGREGADGERAAATGR